MEFCYEKGPRTPFVKEDEVFIKDLHVLTGNPVRFKSGRIPIQLDEEWKKMDIIHRHMVTLLTLPWLLKYGYPLYYRV